MNDQTKRWWWLNAALLVLVVASALAVVYSTHCSRQLFGELQMLQADANQLQVEWGQLLLEESTWSTPGRVERLAKRRLHMRPPEFKEMVVLP